MKKILYSILLLSSSLGFSQIGINTENPEATLHITDYPKTGYTVTNGVIQTPRKEVGIKIPTHTSFPRVPITTDQDKEASQNKNGMLIYLDRPAGNNREALQGFYYWDNNDLSWQNIVDNRETNTDISKTIVSGKNITNNIEINKSANVIFQNENIESFDEDFTIENVDNQSSILVGKTAEYYLLITGSIQKQEGDASVITLDVKRNGNNLVSSSVSLPNNNGNTRDANFYISRIVRFNKNDKLSLSLSTNSSNNNNPPIGVLNSDFVVTFIKLN